MVEGTEDSRKAVGGSGWANRVQQGQWKVVPLVLFLQVRSECRLGELLSREATLGREIRALDSDMQTLLYENYNKFISATGEYLVGILREPKASQEYEIPMCLVSSLQTLSER